LKKDVSRAKPSHPRPHSSSEEESRQPLKIKKRRELKQASKPKSNEQHSIQGELSEIEAFNSAIENFSSS
jgi:hypothetical protein